MKPLRVLVVFSLFGVSGVHWAVLQGVAWARMAYLQAYDPCAICALVDEAAAASSAQTLKGAAAPERAELFFEARPTRAASAAPAFPITRFAASPRDAFSAPAYQPPRTSAV